MLRSDTARALPEGVGQPLMSRLLVGGVSRGWVRAGDVRRVGDALEFMPRWDGPGFSVLWEAACVGDAVDSATRVEFAVRRDGVLVLLAAARLDPRLRAQAGHAQRDVRRAQRRWRGGGR